MLLHKSNADTEAGKVPPASLIALPWAERHISAVSGTELDLRPLYEADKLMS